MILERQVGQVATPAQVEMVAPEASEAWQFLLKDLLVWLELAERLASAATEATVLPVVTASPEAQASLSVSPVLLVAMVATEVEAAMVAPVVRVEPVRFTVPIAQAAMPETVVKPATPETAEMDSPQHPWLARQRRTSAQMAAKAAMAGLAALAVLQELGAGLCPRVASSVLVELEATAATPVAAVAAAVELMVPIRGASTF